MHITHIPKDGICQRSCKGCMQLQHLERQNTQTAKLGLMYKEGTSPSIGLYMFPASQQRTHICCSRLSVDISQKRGKFFEESFPPPKNVFGLHCIVVCFAVLYMEFV